MKKKIALLITTCCMIVGTVSVSATTVSTSEFGNFTYSLTRGGSSVTAITKTTKVAPKLITTMEVQVNATGATLVNTSVTKRNTTNNTIIRAVNNTGIKLAAFSAHEARGKSSTVHYLAEVF